MNKKKAGYLWNEIENDFEPMQNSMEDAILDDVMKSAIGVSSAHNDDASIYRTI